LLREGFLPKLEKRVFCMKNTIFQNEINEEMISPAELKKKR